MDRDDILGRVIHYTALIVPSTLIIYSLFFSTGNTKPFGLYNVTPLSIFGGAFEIHSLTMILLCSVFLFHYLLMGYLYPLVRFIITLVLVMFYVYLGGIEWVTNSFLIRGHGNILFLIIGFVIVCILLERLDNKHGFLKRKPHSLWPLLIVLFFIVIKTTAYIGMWKTGFWELMELIDLGTPAGNPNQNIFWALMKVSEFGYLLPFIRRSEMKAPLRLDPRVLVW